METQTETTEDCECNIHPSVFFLFGTLLVTSCSTAMLCAAIMTDHWEHVTWSRTMLEALANGTSISLQWYLDGAVVKVVDKNRDERLQRNTFLVPMNGGIWTLCVTLSEDEIRLLSQIGFPKNFACNNYLITGGGGGVAMKEDGTDFFKTDWQHRMQNLSISCALVCLIVLGSAALVGAFGVCKHQISAVLVTGVMYLLAALFALFTLMIIHLKRIQTKQGSGINGAIDGVIAFGGGRNLALDLIEARIFTTSWSLDLGWGGVALCTVTSIFWILLSKLMRFNPISAMLV